MEIDSIPLSAIDIAKIAISTGLLAAFFNQGVSWILIRTNKREEAAYLALRLSHLFQTYAMLCIDQMNDNRNYDNSHGVVGTENLTIQSLLELPQDKDGWRWIDIHLADRCLSFQSKILTARKSVEGWWDHDPENASDAVRREITKLAVEASVIAGLLREKYELSAHALSNEYRNVLDEFVGMLSSRRSR